VREMERKRHSEKQ